MAGATHGVNPLERKEQALVGTLPYIETYPLSPDLTHILNEDLYLETGINVSCGQSYIPSSAPQFPRFPTGSPLEG